MKILSFDIGIVNMAYCLMESLPNKQIRILDWQVLNIAGIPDCSMCKKRAKSYVLLNNHKDPTAVSYYCPTHTKNYAEKGMALGKAQDIINELSNSLNYEVGGQIAEQLGGLYLHLFQETTKANIENDPKKIAHCIKIMETLYSGWKEAIEKLKGEKK
mgnify:CR=1 FL=1